MYGVFLYNRRQIYSILFKLVVILNKTLGTGLEINTSCSSIVIIESSKQLTNYGGRFALYEPRVSLNKWS